MEESPEAIRRDAGLGKPCEVLAKAPAREQKMSDMNDSEANSEPAAPVDELSENFAKLNESLSEVMAGALRMQMLLLEDTKNMMAEISFAASAAGARDIDRSGD